MYETFFGFAQRPFQILPDPHFLYRSRKHEMALTCLEYGIFQKAGFIVITGEIGTGKTTLIKHMIRSMNRDLPMAFLSQTHLDPVEFLRSLCQEFSIPCEGRGKADLLVAFNEYLVEQFRGGRYVVLVVDEAQNLPLATLEEIRMLSNLEADDESLLQIILVGQPNLREKLRWEGLRQLAQRVEVSYHLEPLDRDELEGYIRYRIERAGGQDPDLFDEKAMDAIYRHSKGIPRRINALCHMCLVYGMADELKRIDPPLVETVLREQATWDLIPPDGEDPPESPEHLSRGPMELARFEGWVRNLEFGVERILHTLEGLSLLLQRIPQGEPTEEKGDRTRGLWEMLALEREKIDKLSMALKGIERKLDEALSDRREALPSSIQQASGSRGFSKEAVRFFQTFFKPFRKRL